MAVTRAEALSAISKKQDIYIDFLNSFTKSPFSGDLASTKNENSINQALKNLIKTNIGERFFNPGFGSNVYKTLFEPNDANSLDDLEQYIINAIENFEPRVKLLEVIAKPNVSTEFSSNSQFEGQERIRSTVEMPGNGEESVEITIIYNLINKTEPVTLTFLLKRVR